MERVPKVHAKTIHDRHEKHQGFLDNLGNAICKLETQVSNVMVKLMKAHEEI
jgi:hypothetical protein